MSKFTIITDRAMDFVSQAGANFKDAMPDADKLGWQTPEQIAGNIYTYANDPLRKETRMVF